MVRFCSGCNYGFGMYRFAYSLRNQICIAHSRLRTRAGGVDFGMQVRA